MTVTVHDPPVVVWTCRTTSPDDTGRLGRLLGEALEGNELVTLNGDLGMGKTRLVQGLADGLGLPPGTVTSPTFAIRHDHRGRLPLAHLDFYRLSDPDEIDWLGLLDVPDQAVTVIEWADKLQTALPSDRLEIALRPGPERDERVLTWTARGPAAKRVLTAVQTAHAR